MKSLHAAASKGYLQIVKCLIANGAVVDGDKSDWNPLYVAAKEGHLGVVKCLVENNATVGGPSFTSLMTDLCHYINKICSFDRRHNNGTFSEWNCKLEDLPTNINKCSTLSQLISNCSIKRRLSNTKPC